MIAHRVQNAQVSTGFPDWFGGIEDARGFGRSFFARYDGEHRHSGTALMTPEVVPHGRDAAILGRLQRILTEAYQANPANPANPERFVHGCPTSRPLPLAAWINPAVRRIADQPPASCSGRFSPQFIRCADSGGAHGRYRRQRRPRAV